MADIAPWIRAATPAQYYGQGFELGASAQRAQVAAAMEAQKLEEAQRRSDMEAQLQQERTAQNARLEQQRNEISRAYNEARIGLSKQDLAVRQKASELQWIEAGRQLMAQEAFKKDLETMPIEQAIVRHPELGSSISGLAQAASGLRKAELPAGGDVMPSKVFNPYTGEPMPNWMGTTGSSGQRILHRVTPQGQSLQDAVIKSTISQITKWEGDMAMAGDTATTRNMRPMVDAEKKRVNSMLKKMDQPAYYPQVEEENWKDLGGGVSFRVVK